jgi:hypothetical protein
LFGATVAKVNNNGKALFDDLGLQSTPGSGPHNIYFRSGTNSSNSGDGMRKRSFLNTTGILASFVQVCPENEYLDGTQCQSCPLNSQMKDGVTSGTSSSVCLCNENYYRELKGNEMTCNKCQSSSTSLSGSTSPSDCVCETGSYLSESTCLFCDDDEYLDNTSPNRSMWSCATCPSGAACKNNADATSIKGLFGWSRCPSTNERERPTFTSCAFPGACLGSQNLALLGKFHDESGNDLADCIGINCTERCNVGYVNNSTLCGRCDANFSHEGLTGRCKSCPDPALNVLVSLFGVFVGLIGVIVYIHLTLSDAGQADPSDGAKSIGLSFVQLISLLYTFPIAW